MKYWKEAATVILAARHHGCVISTAVPALAAVVPNVRLHGHASTSGTGSDVTRENQPHYVNAIASDSDTDSDTFDYNYKVLMLQRTHQSSFFAGAQVFPGGGIDEADFSQKWMDLFADAGIKTLEDFGPMFSIQHDRPPMIAADRASPVPSDIAFRICAIRETFEESGILLVKPCICCRHADASKPHPSLHELGNHTSFGTTDAGTTSEWRQRVHKNATAFLELCRELKSVPDIWSLAEWSNWLTPSNMQKKRFDTMFYLCCMDNLPTAYQDEKEIIQSQWNTPSQSLAQFGQGEFFLPPPQVYELQRLCRFQKLSDLFRFSQQRALLGCQQYLPVRFNCSDGVISTLPGDYMYPEHPVLHNTPDESIPTLNGTVQEHTDLKSKQLNRQTFALSSNLLCNSLCTLRLPNGHCTPLPFQECVDTLKPKL